MRRNNNTLGDLFYAFAVTIGLLAIIGNLIVIFCKLF
jgi:hypothetical protein